MWEMKSKWFIIQFSSDFGLRFANETSLFIKRQEDAPVIAFRSAVGRMRAGNCS
jgi:hypothetical protein